MQLITRERILLHLLGWTRAAGRFEVPYALTQDGIAEAAWFHPRHAAQYLRPLLSDGLITERKGHVRGCRQRRKVYGLTSSGRRAARRLRESLHAVPVRIREGETETEMLLGELLTRTDDGVRPLDVLHQVVHKGYVKLEALREPREESLVTMLAEAPEVEGFLGRDKELEALTSDEGPGVVVVLGLAGIGKSWLGARACELLQGRRNLFWHRVQPWDSLLSLEAALAWFLAELGRPALQAALAKGDVDRAAQLLREDLPRSRAFLVFDDVHQASPEAMPFFGLLKDALVEAPKVRAAILSRRALPFYDRRDVTLAQSVTEIELSGLVPEEVAGRIDAHDPDRIKELGRRVGGHPLYFDLVRRHPTLSAASGDFHRFLEESVYLGLTEAQRRMMKLASLYRVAVPREAMFHGPSLTHDVLLSLARASLVRRVGEARFAVHDTIREFFADLLSPSERRELGGFARARLRTLADWSLARGDAVAARAALSNALDLAEEDGERLSLLEDLGEATLRMGDPSGAVTAFRRALDFGPDGGTRARLHRKMAAVYEEEGDVTAAQAELDAALSLLGDGNGEERGWANVLRCIVARDLEKLEDARAHGILALNVFRSLEVARGEARSLLELGYVEYTSPDGDAARAEEHLRAALSRAEDLDDPTFLARVRIVLANLLAYEGRPESALEHLAMVEAMPVTASDLHVRKFCLEMKGMVQMLLDAEKARRALQESLALAREMRDRLTEAMAEFGFGWVALFQMRLDEAREHINAHLDFLREQGMAGHAVEVGFYGALCALLQGDLEGFQSILEWMEHPDLTRGRESRYPRIWALRGLRRLLEGDDAAALEAFDVALKSDRMQWACMTHLLHGVVLRTIGRERDAAHHVERAYDLARTYQWRLPMAGMPEIESKLSEVLTTALEKG